MAWVGSAGERSYTGWRTAHRGDVQEGAGARGAGVRSGVVTRVGVRVAPWAVHALGRLRFHGGQTDCHECAPPCCLYHIPWDKKDVMSCDMGNRDDSYVVMSVCCVYPLLLVSRKIR